VHVAGLADVLEGAERPGHFDGVAAVVAKLLVATGECRAYFGEKDFQQLCVVRRLVDDLSLPCEVVGCETVREPDGLALSSRNARLSPTGRSSATVLHTALVAGRAAAAEGASPARCEGAMRAAFDAEPDVELAYAAAVEPATLRAPTSWGQGTELRLLVAARVDGVRLIDNCAATLGRAR
jgi:pantoate--beta-alanine ligase